VFTFTFGSEFTFMFGSGFTFMFGSGFGCQGSREPERGTEHRTKNLAPNPETEHERRTENTEE